MKLKHHRILNSLKYEEYNSIEHSLVKGHYHIDVRTLYEEICWGLNLLDTKEMPLCVNRLNCDVLIYRKLAKTIDISGYVRTR